jgi:hypothetical protein
MHNFAMPNAKASRSSNGSREQSQMRHVPTSGESLWVRLLGMLAGLYLTRAFGSAENWKRRTTIVDYCVNVVDTSIASKRTTIEESADPAAQRKSKAEMYADQVKVCLFALSSSPMCLITCHLTFLA